MKPPVDAPTSRAVRPAGSMAKASSAAISLWAPRLTYGSRSTRRPPPRRRAGHRAFDRAARRRHRRPAPGRPGRAPGPGSGSRRVRARRAAGRVAGVWSGSPVDHATPGRPGRWLPGRPRWVGGPACGGPAKPVTCPAPSVEAIVKSRSSRGLMVDPRPDLAPWLPDSGLPRARIAAQKERGVSDPFPNDHKSQEKDLANVAKGTSGATAA